MTATVAAGQLAAPAGRIAENVDRTLRAMRDARSAGVDLLVLPECGLTGYVFDDAASVHAAALEVDGPELARVASAASGSGLHVVVGYLERAGDRVHNTVTLFGPGGPMATYRKTHLPHLGADRYVTPGDNLPVLVTTPFGVIGLSICYDLRFPEWARCLALGGADIIANPTNWPAPAEQVAELFTRVRAAENHVYVIAANRGDEEEGVSFIGRSQILDPSGAVLASADRGDALVIAAIDPAEARRKEILAPEVDFAISLFGDRRPRLYGELTRETPARKDA
ncbi:carbon-nitrogen hydrolase family protein [Cryptosporangium arvum]|uniref:Putative amidohydrolase n=1 Tax=Cryptosporangium arvum DSM 44712 TaxID=927661 RepID=A0A011AKK6_9ACTN|nr:carbon-nitrogen hydrolase family protein [Cryptosporangium arvum]EXG82506.1 putative amidohydrolase [Cryptosporangium arvum DSM 44712]